MTQDQAPPEGPQHEVVTGLGVDPGAPPEDTFELVGRLVFNQFVRASQEYADAAGGNKPIKWRQEIEALDVVRDDGSAAIFSSSPSMTRGDGVTPLGEGSAANRLALIWKALVGISMNPDDERSKAFIGCVFRFASKRYKVGKDRKTGEQFVVRVFEPVESLGPDFQYQGEVRKLQPREDDSKQAPSSPPPPPPAADEDSTAAQLARVLNGQTRATAQAAVFASPLKSVPMLFGQNIIAALNPPEAPLVDVLVEKGFVTVNEGGAIYALATEAASAEPTVST